VRRVDISLAAFLSKHTFPFVGIFTFLRETVYLIPPPKLGAASGDLSAEFFTFAL
jgi:hypothetical protein